MDKSAIFERIFMLIVFVCAGFSFLLNVNYGFEKFIWQVCVMMWVTIAYMKMRMLEEYEKDKKDDL